MYKVNEPKAVHDKIQCGTCIWVMFYINSLDTSNTILLDFFNNFVRQELEILPGSISQKCGDNFENKSCRNTSGL